MDEDTAIKIEHVSKTFKLPHEKNTSIKSAAINFYKSKRTFEKQRALQDISFEIKKGEFFGIVGRNGSGKSTLLKLLAGIYTADEGAVTVNGKLTPFIELGVGFSPELSGRENVFLNGSLFGFSREEMSVMYRDIVEFAELGRFMDQKLKNYSSGMQVRLAFSIAIRVQSDILLLDEVLAVGDAAFQQKCFDYFEELKQQKRTVVFVSHDMNAVRRFCSRAVYIKDSKLILQGTPSQVADVYLEENMSSERKAPLNNKTTKADTYKVTSKISEQTSDGVKLEVAYSCKDKSKLYLGIALIKDGISIAEITTPHDDPVTGSGKATLSMDTTILNGGVYEVGVALFKLPGRKLLSSGETRSQFIIKGADIRRGAAIKLEDTWQYK